MLPVSGAEKTSGDQSTRPMISFYTGAYSRLVRPPLRAPDRNRFHKSCSRANAFNSWKTGGVLRYFGLHLLVVEFLDRLYMPARELAHALLQATRTFGMLEIHGCPC